MTRYVLQEVTLDNDLHDEEEAFKDRPCAELSEYKQPHVWSWDWIECGIFIGQKLCSSMGNGREPKSLVCETEKESGNQITQNLWTIIRSFNFIPNVTACHRH